MGGAHDVTGHGQRCGVGGTGDAEVGDLDHAVAAHQQVAGLDVAVHDPGRVRGGDAGGGLGDDVGGGLGRHRTALGEQLGQRLTVDQLHHQVGPRVGVVVGARQLAVVEDGGDVGVLQPGRVAGLGGEALPEVLVAGVLVLEHLHRDLAVQHGVVGGPHLAHAAGGDHPLLVVARSLLAHRNTTASMTERAIGAASPLPEIASRATPASSTTTATATWGSSAGAKETNQA